MVSFNYLFATVLAATAVVASPVVASDENVSLEARAGQTYTCKKGNQNDGAVVGTVSQDKVIGYLRQAGTKKGASGYPTTFTNNNNVIKIPSGCTKKQLWELPVLANGKPYDINKKKGDNNPGPMRVYYADDLTFCAVGVKENPENNSGNPHNCKVE
ncbi:uncharacterized protein ASPGLDRAFT_62359 [Aspergillus glaucus CBS 516.65]|uniref:Uncharacterized protein n=1 Tax=Aspergillus glaucus CBS 516.65 TaxID=1160497 RepID=A0A1L9V491_ASPGL|nr:hypothetical protein ASPGLDRAFT_62359 [Aspergillus glaucus CBS 516.65]OJJ78711.1 hypothetical protein ASPGLDRAFT_62359 [Aspergillus glaucus CBS 516.65]